MNTFIEDKLKEFDEFETHGTFEQAKQQIKEFINQCLQDQQEQIKKDIVKYVEQQMFKMAIPENTEYCKALDDVLFVLKSLLPLSNTNTE